MGEILKEQIDGTIQILQVLFEKMAGGENQDKSSLVSLKIFKNFPDSSNLFKYGKICKQIFLETLHKDHAIFNQVTKFGQDSR